MSGSNSKPSGSRSTLWQRLKGMLIKEVPEDIAYCEFECRKGECSSTEWSTCERRINATLPCQSDEAGQDQHANQSTRPQEPA
jgi:hypothetical protein